MQNFINSLWLWMIGGLLLGGLIAWAQAKNAKAEKEEADRKHKELVDAVREGRK